ncbi:MAG: TerD family protein [Jatrophihabitantaceae bacterium]
MTEMTKGGNIPVTAGLVRARLFWSGGDGVPDVDASALLLRASGKVRSDADLVFSNHPDHESGRVKHAGKQTGPHSYDVIDIDLAGLPPDVERITLAASVDGSTFGKVPGLRLVVSSLPDGTELASFAMVALTETAFVTGELYRRADGWRFRAVGQGYDSGLAGLAADYGIDVEGGTDLEPAPAPPQPAVSAPVLPPPSFDPAPIEPSAPDLLDTLLDLDTPRPAPDSVPDPVPAPPPPSGAWSAPPPAWGPPATGAVPVPPPPPAQWAAPPPTATPSTGGGPVRLQRNERFTLAGPSGPLTRITLDLAWYPAPGRRSVDLDASVIAFDANANKLEIVWYQHQSGFAGALQHTGDSRGEHGDGAAERILVDLARLPIDVDALVFTINSFHGHTFTDLDHASCSLADESGRPIVGYDLTDTQPSTAALMAIVRRELAGGWQMRAIGEYHDCRTVRKLVDPAARQVGLR